MGKKKHMDQGSGIGDQKVEKQITGSGADVERGEDAASTGKVKCKCIIPCVWRGYRDEGDTVWIEKELIEKDDFIRAHFEALEPLGSVVSVGSDGGSGNADGDRSTSQQSATHQGECETAAVEGETAAVEGEGAAGGQGELELK